MIGRYSILSLLYFRFKSSPSYVEQSYILNVPEDFTDEIQINVTLPEATAVTMDTTDELSLVDFPDGSAQLRIQRGDVLRLNGVIYRGRAKVWLSARSEDQVANDFLIAPTPLSLFSNLVDDLSGNRLLANNVWYVTVTDISDNPLVLKQSSIEIRPGSSGGTPQLWTMDEDRSYWEPSSEMILNSSGNLTAPVVSGQPFTVGIQCPPVANNNPCVCIVKVRVYENSEFNDNEQIEGVQISLYRFPTGREEFFSTDFKHGEGITDENGACVQVRCNLADLEHTVRIVAFRTGATLPGADPLPPRNHETSIAENTLDQLEYRVNTINDADILRSNIKFIQTNLLHIKDGPVFDSANDCRFSDPSESHFRFYENRRNTNPIIQANN